MKRGIVPIHLEDRKLVKRLLAGEERAFEQFFEENFSRLYRFALARLADDPEGVRDIVQSSLTKGLTKLHTYRGEAALFTWLCTICRNELVDWIRRNARHRNHLVLTEDEPSLRAAIDSLAAPVTDNPVTLYQRHEAARMIQVALDGLPCRYGDALEWKYVEGHSVRDIAQRLGISVDAAQSLLARAKRAFKELYGSLTAGVLEANETQKT